MYELTRVVQLNYYYSLLNEFSVNEFSLNEFSVLSSNICVIKYKKSELERLLGF